ncbi:phosphoribosylformylglycinamidine synthase I [Legionella sp.]|uniref:phosphoribosylformylglycinamidine synthase I n=1 Tax=Legionella sp. TaxID=459 RepID=UPI003C7EF4F4
MLIAIVQFPGSNCERETILAVKRAGMTPIDFLWNESSLKLTACDGYVIVGGFSYEDRSRAGVLAAMDPVMQMLKMQSELGKPILGICNGAQILVEAGLVPGLSNNIVSIALSDNKRIKQGKLLGTGYYNAWIYLKLSLMCKQNAFTRHLNQETIMRVPTAHAEGRFIVSDNLLAVIQSRGLEVFQYCDKNGMVVDEFPINPNGSVNNIAAISNEAGNVLAIMPHPERTTAGDALFSSMRDYIACGYKHQKEVLKYVNHSSLRSRENKIEPNSQETLLDASPISTSRIYSKPKTTRELVVELIITDNHAISVESILHKQGIPVTIKRQIHWEICCNSRSVWHQIQASGLLFNDKKELPVNPKDFKLSHKSLLIRAKDDLIGLQKMQKLKRYVTENGISALRYGILWHISAPEDRLDVLTEQVKNSHILFNPSSHECYYYA